MEEQVEGFETIQMHFRNIVDVNFSFETIEGSKYVRSAPLSMGV